MRKHFWSTFVRGAVAASLLATVGCAVESAVSRGVRDRIAGMDRLGAHDVTVEDTRGVVVLKGSVESHNSSQRIEEAAREVNGVTSVRNELKVTGGRALNGLSADDRGIVSTDIRSGSLRGGSATPLSDQILARLAQQPETRQYEISVTENGGRVILEGETATENLRAKIVDIASDVRGVTDVENRLRIAAPEPDAMVAERVRTTLQSEIASRNVQFDVREGIVTFRGTMPNHREIDRMLASALMVRGVKDVRSEMRIGGSVGERTSLR